VRETIYITPSLRLLRKVLEKEKLLSNILLKIMGNNLKLYVVFEKEFTANFKFFINKINE